MDENEKIAKLEAENKVLRELLQDYVALITTQTTLLAVAKQQIESVNDNINRGNSKIHAFFKEDKRKGVI